MRGLFVFVFIWFSASTYGQKVLNWSDLTQGISWEAPSLENLFPGFQEASFSQDMQDLEGKKVILTGYYLILDSRQSVFLLSKNPMASCFFCGNGGPETVVDLRFSDPPKFNMDDLLSVEGVLRLNPDDPELCYYRIEEANAIRY
ncbi:MAG: DUF3299 domain-containing protein [Bacteroidota bacterium]